MWNQTMISQLTNIKLSYEKNWFVKAIRRLMHIVFMLKQVSSRRQGDHKYSLLNIEFITPCCIENNIELNIFNAICRHLVFNWLIQHNVIYFERIKLQKL